MIGQARAGAWKTFVRGKRALERGVISVRRRAGLFGPLHVFAYRGFGTRESVWIQGRVLVDRGIEPAEADDSLWKNFRMSAKRFLTDEIPGVRVRLAMGQDEEVVVSDADGYILSMLEPGDGVDEDVLWHPVCCELLDPFDRGKDRLVAEGLVQVPPPDCTFGVISDVDDTIVRTTATNFITMARLTLFHNAHTRVPFTGVSAFYHALHRGADHSGTHPFFYVSSSPWNLYDLLEDFFDIHGLPPGTFFLRDLGINETQFIKSSHHAHKLAEIERIMSVFPEMKFVLIGDSGQKDPEIYRQAVIDFPDRVIAVYIRDVKPEISDERDRVVKTIAADVTSRGVPMLPVSDTFEAAVHAAEIGLIDPATLPDIKEERDRDEATDEFALFGDD
jgi:phosphatidate phosphatase APP1